MKILVIGLGSMGSRRIRNLQALNERDIYGYDSDKKAGKRARNKYGIKIITDLKKEKIKFDFAVISTPPRNHLLFAKICAERKWPFFCEFNLLTKDTVAMARIAKKRKVIGIPSNTEEYDRDIISLSKFIGKANKGYFVFHLGQNIHNWHPWEKKGKYFIYQPKTNALREMMRVELPWILKLFGSLKSVSASGQSVFTKKYRINDLLFARLEFASGVVGELIFDVISPFVIKKFTFINNQKTIIWDEPLNQIIIGSQGKKEKKNLNKKTILPDYKFKEDAHLPEMKNALAIIKKKRQQDFDFEDEIKLLQLIDKIEKSASSKF